MFSSIQDNVYKSEKGSYTLDRILIEISIHLKRVQHVSNTCPTCVTNQQDQRDSNTRKKPMLNQLNSSCASKTHVKIKDSYHSTVLLSCISKVFECIIYNMTYKHLSTCINYFTNKNQSLRKVTQLHYCVTIRLRLLTDFTYNLGQRFYKTEKGVTLEILLTEYLQKLILQLHKVHHDRLKMHVCKITQHRSCIMGILVICF